MSAVNLNDITILSSSDLKLLEYESVKEIKNENNFLTIGIICLLGLSIAYIVYLKKKNKSKKLLV